MTRSFTSPVILQRLEGVEQRNRQRAEERAKRREQYRDPHSVNKRKWQDRRLAYLTDSGRTLDLIREGYRPGPRLVSVGQNQEI